MEAYQLSLIIGIALAIAEILTLSFILLGFSIGMLFVAGVQFLFDGFSLSRDLLVFATASGLSFWVFRKFFKKKSDLKPLVQDDINQY
jgi:membrane protein implicated in regulation of membrane protease activity